jgi:hypothetical protein
MKMIDELLAEGYNKIPCKVVGKNLVHVQKRSMILNDLVNAGKLNTYLNIEREVFNYEL